MATTTKAPPKPTANAPARIPRLDDHAGFAQASAKYGELNALYTRATNQLASLNAELEKLPAAADRIEAEAQILAGAGSLDDLAKREAILKRRQEIETEIAALEPRVQVLTRALQIASAAIDAVRPAAMAQAVREYSVDVLAPIAEEATAAAVKFAELLVKLREAADLGERHGLKTGFKFITTWDDWNPRKNAALYKLLREFVSRGLVDESAFLDPA